MSRIVWPEVCGGGWENLREMETGVRREVWDLVDDKCVILLFIVYFFKKKKIKTVQFNK